MATIAVSSTLFGIVHSQDSIACLASSGDFATCCPNYLLGSDPNDGVCTLLTCLELGDVDLSLRSNCDCADVVFGCEQVMPYSSIVPQLPDMCAAVSSCCASGGDDGTTANDEWDGCMSDLRTAGNYTLPDFSTLIPGGVPVIDENSDAVATTTTAVPVLIDDGDMFVSTSTSVPPVATEIVADDVDDVVTTIPSFVPPPSMMCLAAGITTGSESVFLDCCPEASPDDGVCTMLWCVNLVDLSANEGCTCDMIEVACGQVSMFESMVPNLAEACAAVAECCDDDGSTANDEYAACMLERNVTSPDLESLIPGGMPSEMTTTGGDATTTTGPTAVLSDGGTTTMPMAGDAGTAPATTSGGIGRPTLGMMVAHASSYLVVVIVAVLTSSMIV
jgi:hypothetical protein